MRIEELKKLYAAHPGVKALRIAWNSVPKAISLQGLATSAVPIVLSALADEGPLTVVAVMNDAEEAGYFYHDLVQLTDGKETDSMTARTLFFPSSYKRAIKYQQKDDAAEVLRTEVLQRLAGMHSGGEAAGGRVLIVTYPDATIEGVASPGDLSRHTLSLRIGQQTDIGMLAERLGEAGFRRTDYVYEPGQYAVRGSIIDVFSFSSEYPYRIDFFGDDIDSIRTFEVESQLSRERIDEVFITPEQSCAGQASLFDYLPEDSTLLFHDFLWVCERINWVSGEGLGAFGAMDNYQLSITHYQSSNPNPSPLTSNPTYFPSYEIVLDELRDYRFYADDLTHPAPLAVERVWERFADTYFDASTRQAVRRIGEVTRALRHRPLHSESDEYRRFVRQILLKIAEIQKDFPYFEAGNFIDQCHTLLNS